MANVVQYDGAGHLQEWVGLSGYGPSLSGSLQREAIASNTILIAVVVYSANEDGTPSVTSITDNSRELTKIGEFMFDVIGNPGDPPDWPHIKAEMFYLINPDAVSSPLPVAITLSSQVPTGWPGACKAMFMIFRNCYERAPTLAVVDQIVNYNDTITLSFNGSNAGSGSLISYAGGGSGGDPVDDSNAVYSGKGSGTSLYGYNYGSLLTFVENTFITFRHSGDAVIRHVMIMGAELKSEDWIPPGIYPLRFRERTDSKPIRFRERADSKPVRFRMS